MQSDTRLGVSYVFISHDIAVVERISHRVAVMYLGEIVEIGPRRAVLSDPQHPYTRKLISTVPTPDPMRRRERPPILNDEIPSAVRPLDFVAPARSYRAAGPDHFVQVYEAG